MKKEMLLRLGGTIGLGLAIFSGCRPGNNEALPTSPPAITRAADGFVPTPTDILVSEKSTAMELPKPAAWDHVPIVSLVKAVNIPSFPKTAAEAAATFGVDGSTRNPSRWEKTAEGDGWHLSEAQIGDDTKDALNVNPWGYLAEGFYDTEPGRNPFALVAVGIDSNIPAQGATFWNEQRVDQADKLAGEMAVPMWKDENGKVTTYPVAIIVPNPVVSNQGQKAEATPAVPIKYPETAEKAASFFGGKPEQWTLNPSGDWNFNSTEGVVVITLDGVTADGYNKDGPIVATGLNGKVSVELLGATLYNVNLDEVRRLIDAVQANHPDKKVQVVGVK